MSKSTEILNAIMSQRDVYFDASPDNNGMYLCIASAPDTREHIDPIVEKLQERQAWQGELKLIPTEMKGPYAEQLELEECLSAEAAGQSILVLKAGHPKYPTRQESWEKWRSYFLSL